MKKIILIPIFIAFYFSVFAQSFLILDALKQNVSNGSITITDDVDSLMKAQLYVVNTTSASAFFKVKKIENSIASNSENTFCFNNHCYPPIIMEAPDSMLLQAGDTTNSEGFYGDYTAYASGVSVITYVVYNTTNPNDSTYVAVTYNAVSASVPKIDFSKIEFSNPYPNPVISQTKINYNIPVSYNKAILVLRNLIGTPVKEYELGNSQGKLIMDLSDINEGIYFYSLIVDGNNILTRKLIKK